MKHRASKNFWNFYAELPGKIQKLADQNYDLLKNDPRHPSLHFKKVGRFWSARVEIHYRAAAVQEGSDLVCFGSVTIANMTGFLASVNLRRLFTK